jgi:hypothetical protein
MGVRMIATNGIRNVGRDTFPAAPRYCKDQRAKFLLDYAEEQERKNGLITSKAFCPLLPKPGLVMVRILHCHR